MASRPQSIDGAARQTANDRCALVPRDRPFWAEDAYGEIQRVEWIGSVGGPFGPYVAVIDSDGECFPVSDISDWDDDVRRLASRMEGRS